MTPRLMVLGSANVDLFARVQRHPRPGETLLGTGERAGGGKGANQALAAALQGAPVSFVGAVGDDPDAQTAVAALREAGVDLGGLRTVAGTPTGFAVITVAADGENTIVVVPGANATVSPDDARAAVATMGPSDLLLMQGELPREATEAAVREARAGGRRVVLNVAPWTALARDVLTAADPLVLNEHEAAQAAAELGLRPDGDDALGLARALREAGTPSVVVTLGAQGAVLAGADREAHVPSPRVDAVDTTGAGDAFTGALAARLLAGDDLEPSVRHATRVGAYAVQRPGAQPSYPRREEQLP